MAKKKKYVAAGVFRDHADFIKAGETPKTYQVGEDVSHFDKDRLEGDNGLIARGLVKEAGETDAE